MVCKDSNINLIFQKVPGATINPVLLWQVTGTTAPSYQGLSYRSSTNVWYTTYLGVLYPLNVNTGSLGTAFSPQPPAITFNIPVSIQFNNGPIGADLLYYYYTDTISILDRLYSYNPVGPVTTFVLVTYPFLINPILTAVWGILHFHFVF